MGELFGLSLFLGIVLGKDRVVHPNLVSRLYEVVPQKAIAGVNQPCLTSSEIPRLVFRPSKPGELSKLLMAGVLSNVTDLGDDS